MTEIPHYRLDDLRRFAATLAAGAGVPPARAASLASHLLWFDAAGASAHGVASLPGILDAIEAGSVDPATEGAVVAERSATAVFDGRRGVPLLVLGRAAGIAAEKARDTGVGFVRVLNVAPPGSAAVVAAEMAVGPVIGLVLGPGASWSVALPAEGGLPAVFDTGLVADRPGKSKGAPTVSPRQVFEAMAPWAAVLAPGDGWLVAAVSVTAVDPLSTFHARVAETLGALGEGPGRLLPGPWEERRRAARGRGVAVESGAWKALLGRAGRAGVEPPAPAARPG